MVTFENGKIITIQKAKLEGFRSTKIVREIIGEDLVQTMTIDGVEDLICVQKFRRL